MRNIPTTGSSSPVPIHLQPKHKGLTYFWVDMKAPGVTVRPFMLLNGEQQCNEVFFDDVKLDRWPAYRAGRRRVRRGVGDADDRKICRIGR